MPAQTLAPWHPDPVGRLRAAAALVVRALASPTALSTTAWLIPLPLLLMDALVGSVLLLSMLAWSNVAVLLLIMLGTYSASWLVFRGGAIAQGASAGQGIRAAVAMGTFAIAGAVWFGVLGWSLSWLAGTTGLPAPLPAVMATGAVLQMLLGTLIAVVLFARRTANDARAQAAVQQAALEEGITTLRMVRAAARDTLASWIEQVLAPGVGRLRVAIAGVRTHDSPSDIDRVLREIDDFRESTVRRGSHGMHPRLARLGVRAAMVATAHHCGHPEARVEVVDDEPSETVGACLVRIVDLVLASAPAQATPVITLGHSADIWRLSVEGVLLDPFGLTLAEARARIREHHGVLAVSSEPGGVILEIPDGGARHPTRMPVGWSTSTVSAVVILPITALLLVLLGLGWQAVMLGTAASLSVAGFARVIVGSASSAVVALTVRIVSVGVLTSAVMTVALVWAGVPASFIDAFPWISLANAAAISAILGLAVIAGRMIRTWSDRAHLAELAAEQARQGAAEAAREIDGLRERVAGVLHSRVQARLVAASGRLQHQPLRSSDIDHSLHAIGVIERVDLPDLRRIVTGSDTCPQVSDVLGEFAGVEGLRVTCRIDATVGADAEARIAEIVREAVSNAIVHGAATCVDVRVETVGGEHVVHVSDDGLGVEHPVSFGLGSALIDAASSGTWELRQRQQGGAELMAVVAS